MYKTLKKRELKKQPELSLGKARKFLSDVTSIVI